MQNQKGLRIRSTQTFCGLPVVDIALGPDPSKGEMRGHARGIIAVGDIARGWIALGGVAFGGITFGGVALGIISIGGLAVGLLAALGGLAIGGIALGGAAVGFVAIGGGAIGYFAFGGGAFGKHVISEMHRSPEAVKFFRHWFPFLPIPFE